MVLSLRKALASDIDFLQQLRDASMRKYLIDAGMPTSREAYLQRVQYQFEHAKVVEVNGESAGLFKSLFEPKQHRWYLVQIQIMPIYQRAGIGRQLIQQLIEQSHQQNFDVGLSVIKSNPAKRLYERLGFVVVDESDCEFEMVNFAVTKSTPVSNLSENKRF
ncbi:GNAT family N-acetyltransferase [Thaumasiovibrio subtropicus]|uniref:GNAT family N-acetyltransferase n=1 Tax=Thaumasiovibrio subtropicus TaxID=1891207 RepID=UPI000B3614B3|nr:GNAT family N-acetyltransferase [Thaumasiovibrio subtropicus]